MEADEYLNVVVGDIGRLITGIFHLLEFILGLIYLVGQTLTNWLLVSGSQILAFITQTASFLKLVGGECWEFGVEIVKGISLIYYAIWMVFESFYIISMDLKSFIVHMFISVGQLLQNINTAIVDNGIRAFSVVPQHICHSLILIGENAIFVFQTSFGIILDFLTQLVFAPLSVIHTAFLLIAKVLEIPFYLYDSFINIPRAAKAGLAVVIFLCVLYWKINLLKIPRRTWNLVKRIFSKIVDLMRKSRRILSEVSECSTDVRPTDTKALCVICQEEMVSFISIPCKHVCLCLTCVKALVNFDNRCPLCRGAVTKFERVYIPL